jgi:phosphate transport system protein
MAREIAMAAPIDKSHTDRAYEGDLQTLREQLLLMAGRVEQMIADAERALAERDAELARQTIRCDHKVNRAEIDIDEHCLVILAKRQPMATDLRLVTAALKMVTDLERIGDLAVNICERVLDLHPLPPLPPYPALGQMTSTVQSMIRDAIDAFVNLDCELAEQVVQRDDEVDELYHQVFREVLGAMIRDPSLLERGIHLQSVAKFVERMGDHSTNLAEHVIYLGRARDVRHHGKLDSEHPPSEKGEGDDEQT